MSTWRRFLEFGVGGAGPRRISSMDAPALTFRSPANAQEWAPLRRVCSPGSARRGRQSWLMELGLANRGEAR